MAATVQIHEMTDTDTGVDKTSGTVRFKSADETAVDTANRLTIPGAAEDWSYTKQLRLYASDDPSVDITNIEAYSDESVFSADINVDYDVHTAFQTATDSDIAGTDLFTKGSGDPIDMDGFNAGPWTTGDTPCYMGDYLELQMGVESTASPGALSAETLTFSYDET